MDTVCGPRFGGIALLEERKTPREFFTILKIDEFGIEWFIWGSEVFGDLVSDQWQI